MNFYQLNPRRVSRLEFIETLDELTRIVRTGQFELGMKDAARTWQDSYKRLRALDERSALRLVSFNSQILDHYGEYSEAEELIAPEGGRSVDLLSSVVQETGARGLKQHCWIVLMYARTIYHRHEYKRSREMVELCRRVVEQTPRSHRLRGAVLYSLAHIARNDGRFDEAEEHLRGSMDSVYQRLQQKVESPDTEQSRPQEKVDYERGYATHFLAEALGLGFGWMYYRRGLHGKAKPFLLAARTLLHGAKDGVLRGMMDMILGNLQRAGAGSDHERLSVAVATLRQAYDAMDEAGHKPYLARTSYGLARAYLAQRQLVDASRYGRQLRQTAEQCRDARWQWIATNLESRIALAEGRPDHAERLANDVVEAARSDRFVLTDALIDRGRARLECGRFDEARHDFERAAGSAPDNPMVRGLCVLLIASSWSRKGVSEKAKGELAKWNALAGSVETAEAHELAARIELELETGFTIPVDIGDLNYKSHVQRLRKFLVARARERCSNKEEIATKLGITRQTLNNWFVESESK